LSTHNRLCQKFSAACWKAATFSAYLSSTHDADVLAVDSKNDASLDKLLRAFRFSLLVLVLIGSHWACSYVYGHLVCKKLRLHCKC